jgi:hypothetical protein
MAPRLNEIFGQSRSGPQATRAVWGLYSWPSSWPRGPSGWR